MTALPAHSGGRVSGVSSIGIIPTSWRIVRLKQVIDQERPITYGIVQAGSNVEHGVPYIRPVDMSDEQGLVDIGGLLRTSKQIATSYRRSSIRGGDLVCSIGPSFGKVMVVPASLEAANLTQGTARVAVSSENDRRFLFWVLRSTASFQQWESSVGGATFRALNLGPLAETALALPPLPEQVQIGRFLDCETARIDALIEKQRQLIALLKEKRQAVISHAVTKGLNPNAPLRESGIEWLGMVPAHWDVLPIRHALWIDNGPRLPINREERAKIAGPYPYWGPTGVLDHIDHFRYEGERVIIGEDGDHFLKFAIWPMTHWVSGRFNVNNHAHVVATGRKCSARWFYYSFLHRDLGADVIAQGVSRLKLTREGLSKLILAVPPLDEQLGLIAHIEPIIAKVEAATTKAERQIELLHERRSALISAAVTGKIDVRGWEPAKFKVEQDVA